MTTSSAGTILKAVRSLAPILVTTGLATGPGSHVAAQVPEEAPDRVLVLGLVLDGSNEDRVPGALVRFEEAGVVVRSDERGEFHLPAFPAGEHTVVANHWGYLPQEVSAEVADNVLLVLRLDPDPIVLEAIDVSVERSSVTYRIQLRARSMGRSFRALDRERLLLTSASNAMEALQNRYGIRWLPCADDEPGDQNCLLSRGRPLRPVVFLDDVRLTGGLGVLEHLAPHQLHRVEYFPSPVNQLRVYTPSYVDWLARAGLTLPPICVGC